MDKQNQMVVALNEWASVFFRRSIVDFMKFTHQNGLSLSQINVLMKLYYDGATTILSIRQSLYGSRSAVTQLVDKLVQMGLVDRSESPEDRRVKVICLTDNGKALVKESIVSRQKWIEPMVENFNAEEQNMMTDTLKRLTRAALKLVEDQGSLSQLGEL